MRVEANRVRVSGILALGNRGILLTTSDSKLWVIESDLQVDQFVGQNVTVEGTAIGFDRLRADWIGPAQTAA